MIEKDIREERGTMGSGGRGLGVFLLSFMFYLSLVWCMCCMLYGVLCGVVYTRVVVYIPVVYIYVWCIYVWCGVYTCGIYTCGVYVRRARTYVILNFRNNHL